MAGAFVLAVAVIGFVWLGTHAAGTVLQPVQPSPPPAPTPVNDSTAAPRPRPALPTGQPLRIVTEWTAPVIVTAPTPECGYDTLLALRDGKDTLYVRTQVAPVWLRSTAVYEVGRWASEGSLLLAAGNEALPITKCAGGADWERVSSAVSTDGLLVCYVESGVPVGPNERTAAFYVWPLRVEIALAEPLERPSHLRSSGAAFELYSWSARAGTVYVRRSVDGGRSWSSPRILIASDAVQPRVIGLPSGTLLLGAVQPSTGNLRFLLSTGVWAPAPSRTLHLHSVAGMDTFTAAHTVERNLTHQVHLASIGSLLHVWGADARSTTSILVSAHSCRREDVYPSCTSDQVVPRCTPNPHVLASACLRLAVPLLHDFHAVSHNDALTFEMVGASDEDQTAPRAVLVLPNGTAVVAYYRVREEQLERMELRLRIGSTDLLIDILDGYVQAYSAGGAAFDGLGVALRFEHPSLYLAYSRTIPGAPPAWNSTLFDTRERSRMTVVRVDI